MRGCRLYPLKNVRASLDHNECEQHGLTWIGLPSNMFSGTQNSGASAGRAVMLINSVLMMCSQK